MDASLLHCLTVMDLLMKLGVQEIRDLAENSASGTHIHKA